MIESDEKLVAKNDLKQLKDEMEQLDEEIQKGIITEGLILMKLQQSQDPWVALQNSTDIPWSFVDGGISLLSSPSTQTSEISNSNTPNGGDDTKVASMKDSSFTSRTIQPIPRGDQQQEHKKPDSVDDEKSVISTGSI